MAEIKTSRTIPDALAGRDYAKGMYESARAGIACAVGDNFLSLDVYRDAWDTLNGPGKIEYTGATDPFTGVDYKIGGNEKEVVRVFVWISYDGGNTWQPGGMLGACGGAHVFRSGQLATKSTFSVWLPEAQNPNRLIRIVADVRKGVRTKIDAHVLTITAAPFLLRDDHHSVAIHAVSAGAQGTAVSSIGTGSLTPTGSDRALFISGGNAGGGGGQTVTFAWDGGAITQELWDLQGQTYFAVAAGYLLAPATSVASGTMTMPGPNDEIYAGAVSMDGVDQTTPVVGTATAQGSTGASSVTTAASAAADDCVLDTVHHYDTGYTAAQGQTPRWDELNIGGNTCGACGSKTGTGAITMGYNAPANNSWLIGATIFKAAAGGGAPTPSRTPVRNSSRMRPFMHF